MANLVAANADWRARARLAAAVGVLALLSTVVAVAPYSVDSQSEAVDTQPAADSPAENPTEAAAEAAADTAATDAHNARTVVDGEDVFGSAATIGDQDDVASATAPGSGDSTSAAVESVPAIDPSLPAADLSVAVEPERDPILSESFISYIVTVTNDGPDEAVNVVVTNDLPPFMSFISLSGCWLANDTFPECHLNEIPAGASRSYQVLALVGPGVVGEHAFAVAATSETADPDPTNNAAEFVSTVNIRATWSEISATADLSISKIDLVDPVPALGTITYRITVANDGPNAAIDVEATETLPLGVTLISTSGCLGPAVPTCALGTIPPGETRSFDVVVSADAGTVGDITNAVAVSARSNDTNGSNNTATETTTIEFGTIILENQTDPDGSTETFTFTGDLAGELGDGDTLEASGLLAGTYTATELVPAGWGIADITCDDTDSSGDPTTGVVTFNIVGDEIVRCVVTNALLGSVTIVKDTVGIDGASGFTGDFGSFDLTTIANTASTTFDDVLPGTYAVTEDDPSPAFYLTGLDCVDADAGSSGDIAARTASIDLDAGETVTCTFTNAESGTVTINKDTIGGDGTFDFSGDLGPTSITTAGNAGSTTITGIAPGSYALIEDDPLPAFALTGLSCTDPDSQTTVDVGARTATIDIDPGEDVSCSFTNTETGTIIVEKQTLPDGDPQLFAFTGDAAGSVADDGTITIGGLLPGSYTSTEAVLAGWELTDISCDDINSSDDIGTATATFTVEAGETVTCVFTNTKAGTIIVEKQTAPDGGTGNFTFTGDVSGVISDGENIIVNDLEPGTYTSTESDPTPGFDLTSITCDDTNSTGDTGTRTATFNVEAGETVTCVFANTERGTIIVEKQTLPDGAVGDFTFTGDAAGTIADDGTIVVPGLVAGTYTSTETPLAGFDLTDITCDDTNSTGDTGTGTATFELDPGETVTCTFTNTQRGTIIVEKQTTPDGASGNFTFTGDVAGAISDNGTITVADLEPGTYTSTETPLAGFDLTDITCDDTNSTGDTGTGTATFELDPGETVTCTFTNTQRGTIIVEKQTTPDGASGNFTFTGDVAGAISDNGTITVADLEPGTYTSTESDPTPRFDLTDITCDDTNSTGDTGTGTATFELDPGETVTCVFTNTQRATLRVATLTDPAGQPGDFDYTGAINFTQSHGDLATAVEQVPGQYTITQSSAPVGLPLSDITCSDGNSTGDVGTATATFELEPGEDVTCTFTNSVPGSITILKNSIAGDDVFSFTGDLGDFDLDTTGSGTAMTTFNDVVVGTYVITESDPAPATLTGLACNDGGSTTPSTTSLATRTATIEVDAAESITCTFTNSFNLPPAITGGPTAAVNADENQTAVTDVDSTDSADSEGSGLTYSLTGGADAAFFTIDPNTGVLTFTTAPDFETPADDDADNGYEVQVTVTDSGGLTDFQDITVTVLDVNDAPVVTTSGGTTAFTEAAGAVAVDSGLAVLDQDGGNLASATVTITNLLDGADEVLTAATGGTSITAGYAAGTLTLTGPDTIANFEAVMQSVTYENLSLDPDETDRTIRFVVNDGTVDSNNGDKTVSVTAVNSPPTAANDNYNNVPVNVVLEAGTGLGGIAVSSTADVLDNDTDPEGDSLSVTGITGCVDTTAPFTNCATTGGGLVTMNADGTFTYVSQPGETAASDTFAYTVSDNGSPIESNTATVTITFGTDTIWFIDAAASAGGNGTSKSPFTTVAAYNSTATDDAGDIIYVAGGTYTDAAFSLQANQQLIGATIGLTSGSLTIPASGGAAPTISSASGDIVILLSTNNTVRGFSSAGSLGAGSIVGTNVGTPVINSFTINGPGSALELTNANVSNVALGSITTSSSNVDGVSLNNVTGTLNLTAPVSISGSSGDGIDIRNSSATINFSSTVDVTNSGGTGVLLTNNTGTVTFADLDVNNSTSNQPGIVATGGGTLNITTGTVNSGTATAVDASGMTLGVTLSSASSNGGTAPGIELRSTTGSFTANGGTIANKNGADVGVGAKSPTGDGIGVYIDGASSVTLSGMTINGTMQNFGIRGFDLSGTTNFTNLTMNGTYGTTATSDEATVTLDNVSGTLNVTGGTYQGGHEDLFSVYNASGTLSATVSGATFNASQAATGNNAVVFRTVSPGSGTLNLSVQGNSFNAARSVMLFVDVAGSGGGTVNVGNVTANTFTQGQANLSSGGAIEVLASGSGNTATVSTIIANNIITAGSNTFEGDVVVAGTTFGFAGTHNLTLTNNQIGINGVNGSAVNPAGIQGDTGIVISQNGTGTLNVLLSNNGIFDYNDRGIEVFFDAEGPSDPVGGTLNITVTGNTISDAGTENHALQFTGDDQVDTCMSVSGNSLTSAGDEIRVDVFGEAGTIFNVAGLSTLTEAGIDALWTGANTLGGASPNVQVFSVAPSTIGTVGSCPQP